MATPHHRFYTLNRKAREQLEKAAEHGKAGRWPEASDCTHAAKGWIELACQYSEAYAVGNGHDQEAAEEIETDGFDASRPVGPDPFDQEHEEERGVASDS